MKKKLFPILSLLLYTMLHIPAFAGIGGYVKKALPKLQAVRITSTCAAPLISASGTTTLCTGGSVTLSAVPVPSSLSTFIWKCCLE